MADKLPIPASISAKARAQDVELLEADARRALTADRPATDALWTALLKPRDVILRRYRETMARMATDATAPAMALLTTPEGRAMGDGPSALIAMAETMVARAILGEQDAAQHIMTRIEGVPSKRAGDADEEGNTRGELVASIEELVRQMHDAAAKRPGDDAKIINMPPPKPKPTNGHDE